MMFHPRKATVKIKRKAWDNGLESFISRVSDVQSLKRERKKRNFLISLKN